jgi:hypothetical protein
VLIFEQLDNAPLQGQVGIGYSVRQLILFHFPFFLLTGDYLLSSHSRLFVAPMVGRQHGTVMLRQCVPTGQQSILRFFSEVGTCFCNMMFYDTDKYYN